jgi:hypothetical protein
MCARGAAPRRDVRALGDALVLIATRLERIAQRQWNQDLFVAKALGTAIDLIMVRLMPPGEEATPPAVVEHASQNKLAEGLREQYLSATGFGLIEGGAPLAVIEQGGPQWDPLRRR